MTHNTLRAAAIFSSDMVLQRDKPVPVWGAADGKGTVEVTWQTARDTVRVCAPVRDGQWRAVLPPREGGELGTLAVSDGTAEQRFTNVIFGDVWFAGGQSNMELELQNCLNGKEELAASSNPDIRFYQVVKRAWIDQEYLWDEEHACWKVCGPKTAAALSAVAWFFARKINADVGVPIGIINCSWGGTSISAWMGEERLARSVAGQRFLNSYAALMGNKSDEQYGAEMWNYVRQWSEWDKRIQARRKIDPSVTWEVLNAECGVCPWPQPAGRKSPYHPTNLYNSMVRRIVPFGLKGFLYYQGEEDELRAADYGEMMYYLIDQWRSDWEDDSLPFLFVQLPMYASREEAESGQPSKNWCVLRENQWRASRTIANTGMAVIIDRGEYDNIHPFDKQTVGYRLALQALKKVYGVPVEADGPVFAYAEPEGSALRVHFANAESGLEARGALEGFEVAGTDGLYYPAEAAIQGDTALVCSPKVTQPERVRYAWIKYGPTPLFAKNGLPAMPFRSHCSDL
jgi:sialate O-acetylesterase